MVDFNVLVKIFHRLFFYVAEVKIHFNCQLLCFIVLSRILIGIRDDYWNTLD